MKIYKREIGGGDVWWLDTTVDGQRYRISLDTKNWREAWKRANEKINEILSGKITTVSLTFAKLKFDEACGKFLEDRKLELRPSTFIKEEQI
jgi:hypothetical protein